MKHLYFCVGCRCVHFDDDFDSDDGDLLIVDSVRFLGSVLDVQKKLKRMLKG